MRQPRRAFTLIELLVVIGIIAALIAILLPSLEGVREQARRVTCMSNVRQLTMAWLMYANEHRGRFCSSDTQTLVHNQYDVFDEGIAPLNGPKTTGFWSWIGDGGITRHDFRSGLLWPYVKDEEVYRCPNDPIRPNTVYAINGYLAGQVGNPDTLLSLRQIKRADQTFVFIEALFVISGDGDADLGDGDDPTVIGPFHGSFRTPIYPRSFFLQLPGNFHPEKHGYAAILSFADGHSLIWKYDSQPTIDVFTSALKQIRTNQTASNPDVRQLEAWSGGPIPPGANP